MDFDAATIGTWVGSYLWAFFRIASMYMIMPVFGANTVPARVRLTLAFFTSLVVAPLIPELPAVDPLSFPSILIIAQQILIGSVMGFFLQLFFQIFVLAGQFISMQIGLGMANMMDPANGVSVPILGQLYMIIVSLLFLIMNGHLVVIEVLAESFRTLPIGADVMLSMQMTDVAAWGTWMFGSAFLIALPVVTAALIVNFTFGVISRASPQMNIFALGFPMTMLFGLFIFWASFGTVLPQYHKLISEALLGLRTLVMA